MILGCQARLLSLLSIPPEHPSAAAMHVSIILAVLPLAALATPNGRCTGDQATGRWKQSGICISTSNCRNRGGKTKNGACPFDGDDIKCCLIGVEPSDVNP